MTEKDVLDELRAQHQQIRYLVDEAGSANATLDEIKALLARIAKALEAKR